MSRATFEGTTALVTGAASGIGRGLAEALARRGSHVVLADLNGPRAEEVADAIRRAGGAAEGHALDVTDAEAFERLVGAVVASRGGVDYLFNNAGVFLGVDARHMKRDDWSRMIDVNLRGVVHGVHAAYPTMARRRAGHIVNTGSIAGLTPVPMSAAYTATKHAVVGLSTSLRAEAAALGVRVSVVCPGIVDTALYDGKPPEALSRDVIFGELPTRPLTVEEAVGEILDGVARDRPIIVLPRMARVIWYLQRLSPRFSIWAYQYAVYRLRRRQRAERGAAAAG